MRSSIYTVVSQAMLLLEYGNLMSKRLTMLQKQAIYIYYVDGGLTSIEVSKLLGIRNSTVLARLRHWGIVRHHGAPVGRSWTEEQRKTNSDTKKLVGILTRMYEVTISRGSGYIHILFMKSREYKNFVDRLEKTRAIDAVDIIEDPETFKMRVSFKTKYVEEILNSF